MNDADEMMRVSQLVQAWGFYRDQGLWRELAATFTEDGAISVSWFSGTIGQFIEYARSAHSEKAPRGKHLIGLPVVTIYGNRAIAQTNIQILGRALVSGILVDNTSYARFVDRIVKMNDGWRIAERVAVYEKDRFDPVTPSPAFDRFMAETDFSDIPEPYRYLGFRLQQSGRSLRPDIVVDGSPAALDLL